MKTTRFCSFLLGRRKVNTWENKKVKYGETIKERG
jgi:hypothetical protein